MNTLLVKHTKGATDDRLRCEHRWHVLQIFPKTHASQQNPCSPVKLGTRGVKWPCGTQGHKPS
jgi:hypothetical protein